MFKLVFAFFKYNGINEFFDFNYLTAFIFFVHLVLKIVSFGFCAYKHQKWCFFLHKFNN